MKTYEMMMLEVMTMTDMNKIKGGTQDQRRIAQERQRAREKKNAQSDPLSKAAPGVKAPPTPTKASAATDPLKKAAPGVSSSAIQKSTGLAKKETKALPPSKGGSMVPSKKSQMGKWSQGIKQSPGKLARTNSSSSRTSKEAIGAPKKSGPGVKQPQGSGSKTYDRINPKRSHKKGGDLMAPDEAKMRRDRELNKKLDKEDAKKGRLGRFAKGAAKTAGKAVGSAANAMAGVGTEVGVKQGKDLKGPEVGTK